MKKFTFLLVSIFLIIRFGIPSPAMSQSTEVLLSLENGMQAIHAPAKGKTKSSVLLIHGWAGQMDEVGDLYKRLANQLSKIGIASLRINIRGESEREKTNYTLTSTFDSRVEDAENGLNYLLQKYPSLPVGILGFSLGGSTAIALAGKMPNKINSLVLWSSAGNPRDVANTLINKSQQAEIIENGYVIVKEWVDIAVTKKHFDGFDVPDILPTLSNYKGALLTIRGTEDSIPNIDKIIVDLADGQNKEFRYIFGADHIFNVFDSKTQYDISLLNQTSDWFKYTL